MAGYKNRSIGILYKNRNLMNLILYNSENMVILNPFFIKSYFCEFPSKTQTPNSNIPNEMKKSRIHRKSSVILFPLDINRL